MDGGGNRAAIRAAEVGAGESGIAPPEGAPALEMRGVSKVHRQADGSPLTVVSGVALALEAGETAAVLGRSGSGKSTLLHLAAGIETPTAGVVRLAGRDLAALGDRERSRFRGRSAGLVFQSFHLIPYLTARENLLLPARIAGTSRLADGETVEDAADRLLAAVRLSDRAGEPARHLSGGEMQRAAIARALLLRPPLVLADEPTGNLDGAVAAPVVDLLFSMADGQGAALLVATHDPGLAGSCRVRYRLDDASLARLPDGEDPAPGAAR